MEPDLPACAIGFAGVYDLTLMKDEDLGEEKLFAERLYEDYEENAERYHDLSPANQAAKIKAPVLIIHGGKDHRVGY